MSKTIQSNFWLFINGEPGSLIYAEQVQKKFGGVIRCDDGWYWVDGASK